MGTHGSDVFVWIGEEGIGLCWSLLQKTLKLVAGICEAVVDVMREAVQSAHGRLLLWGIP